MNSLSRRDFLKQLALIVLLATPIGKYVVGKWKEAHPPVQKLKTQWTTEAAQDLEAFHGLHAESELVRQMKIEISREIDLDIIAQLRAAQHNARVVNWLDTSVRHTEEVSSILTASMTNGGYNG